MPLPSNVIVTDGRATHIDDEIGEQDITMSGMPAMGAAGIGLLERNDAAHPADARLIDPLADTNAGTPGDPLADESFRRPQLLASGSGGRGGRVAKPMGAGEKTARNRAAALPHLSWSEEIGSISAENEARRADSGEGKSGKTVDFSVTIMDQGQVIVVISQFGRIGQWIHASVDDEADPGAALGTGHTESGIGSQSAAAAAAVAAELGIDDDLSGGLGDDGLTSLGQAQKMTTYDTEIVFGRGANKDFQRVYARRLIELFHKQRGGVREILLGIGMKDPSPTVFRECIASVERRVE